MAFTDMMEVFIKEGPLAAVFLVVLLLFYKLTWKVWSGAMASKDKEIERLLDLNEALLKRIIKQEDRNN